MDLSLMALGGLAAAMALDAAPDPTPAPVSPAETPAACDTLEGEPARAKCRRERNEVDPLTIEGGKPDAAEGPIEAEVSFDEDAIAAMGANSLSEVIIQLESQLRSNRGRAGDEPPVMLINGQRISGPMETADIPPEAVKRIDILREEAALAYGFRADQRVMNIVLKKDARIRTVSGEGRWVTRGGRAGSEQRGSLFRSNDESRTSVSVRYSRDSPLYETERDVVRAVTESAPYDLEGNLVAPGGEIDPALSALAGGVVSRASVPDTAAGGRPGLADFLAGAGRLSSDDLTASRSLAPRQEDLGVKAAYSRNFGKTTVVFSAGLDSGNRVFDRGLTGAAVPIAAGSPFSPFARDVVLYRYFGGPEDLRSRADTDRVQFAALARGRRADWNWTLAGAFDRVENTNRNGQGVDVSAFQAAVAAGDPTVNPFGPVPASLIKPIAPDTAQAVTYISKVEATLSGTLAQLPAGRLSGAFKASVDRRQAESESVRSGVHETRDLTRDRATVFANVSLPLTSRANGVLPVLGDIGLNGNVTYEEFSDLGGLVTAGGGVSWRPVKRLKLSADYSHEEGEPGLEQVNNPVIRRPNVWMYDFASGTSVNVTYINGGNPDLTPDSRQVIKLGLDYKPFEKRDLNLVVNYVASRIDDQIASFPVISPELEAAFPERFMRDAGGTLVSVDLRPVNFAYEDKRELKATLSYSRRLGTPPPPPPKPGAGPGAGASVAFRPQQGFVNVSLDYTARLKDEVVIRRGMAPLDLLDGASLGQRGGKSRHEVSLNGFFGYNGMGGNLRSSWKSATRVDGGPRGQDLRFSDLTMVYVTAWVDLGERPTLAKDRPWLKGTRLSLSVDNLLGSRQTVRDADGRTPQAYQKDYLDPLGRQVRLNLRKKF